MYANSQKSDRIMRDQPMILGATIGQGVPAPESPKAAEIYREHQELREAVDNLGRVVMALTERLQPIVMQRPVAGTAPQPIEPMNSNCFSAVGQELLSTRGSVQMHTSRLIDLLDTLAV